MKLRNQDLAGLQGRLSREISKENPFIRFFFPSPFEFEIESVALFWSTSWLLAFLFSLMSGRTTPSFHSGSSRTMQDSCFRTKRCNQGLRFQRDCLSCLQGHLMHGLLQNLHFDLSSVCPARSSKPRPVLLFQNFLDRHPGTKSKHVEDHQKKLMDLCFVKDAL